MISRKKHLAALVLCGIVVACGKDSQSTEKHDDGKIIRSSLHSNWLIMDRASFLTDVLNLSETDAVPANSFSTLLIKGWVDRIDAYARRRDPVLLAGIPKPNVLVVKEEEANAFVMGMRVCYNVKVTYGDGSKSAPNGVYLSRTRDRLEMDRPDDSPCIEASPLDLTGIAAEISNRGLKCSFKITKDGIEFPNNCHVSDKAYTWGFTSQKLFLNKTPNWIVVNSGLKNKLQNEESLAAVIAHELGHYYRSHVNYYQNDYDFFYRLYDAGNPNHKPVRDELLEQLGKTVSQASAAFAPYNHIPLDPKILKLDFILFLPLGDIARQASVLPSCRNAAAFDDPTTAKELAMMPYSAPDNLDTFSRFAGLMNQCLEDIEASGNVKDKINLNYGLEEAFTRPSWAPYKKNSNYTVEERVALMAYTKALYEFLSSNITFPRTFTKNEILDLGRAQIARGAQILEILQAAYDAKLGHYTTEQEADELAVEILSNLGLGAETAVDVEMAFLPEEEDLGGWVLGRDRCEKMRANNWVDPDGYYNSLVLPIGNYSEQHHSACFRAFNASREIAAHGYQRRAKSPLDTSNWVKFKEDLSSDKNGFNRLKKAKNPKKTVVYPKNCTFAPKA